VITIKIVITKMLFVIFNTRAKSIGCCLPDSGDFICTGRPFGNILLDMRTPEQLEFFMLLQYQYL
jgi:hypothetical protein